MVVGLDLGTTTCRAAIAGDRGPEAVPTRFGAGRLPVFAEVEPSQGPHPGSTPPAVRFEGLKQKMWSGGLVPGLTGLVPASEELANLAGAVREDVLAVTEEAITGVVATVPGVVPERSRAMVRDAVLRGGWPAVRLLDEARAAVLGGGHADVDRRTLLVYSLGAGVFCATVVHVAKGEPRMLSVEGALDLGGFSFDAALLGLVLGKLGPGRGRWKDETAAVAGALRMRTLAEQVKEGLSRRDHEEFEIDLADVFDGGRRETLSVTRAEFEAAIEGLVGRTLALSKRALEEAGVAPASIAEILLVGGSTRVPLVERELTGWLSRPARRAADDAIALGAALYGQRSGEQDWTRREPAPAPAVPVHEPPAPDTPAPDARPRGRWIDVFGGPIAEAEALWRTDRAASIERFERGLAEAHELLGTLLRSHAEELIQAGRHVEAVERLAWASEHSPNDERVRQTYHYALNRLGEHWYREGDYLKAREVIRRSLALDGQCPGCRQLASAIDAAIQRPVGRRSAWRDGRRRGR